MLVYGDAATYPTSVSAFVARPLTKPLDMEVTGGIGIRSVKGTGAGNAYAKEQLNLFGFALGFAKKLHVVKSPKVYAQFMWNMDIYKGFGDAQPS